MTRPRSKSRTVKIHSSRRMLLVVLALLAGAVIIISPLRRYVHWARLRLTGGATVAQRLEQYGPAARQRLTPFFDHAGVTYPPAELVLIGIKDRRELEVWARSGSQPFVHVRTYPVLGASGRAGPKLRQGDRQVPEGLYRIESLHPNSMFHLALRVDYPNDDDRRRAQADGRQRLGGDIMIHGSDGSVGCLAMGDEAAEDLFVMVADAGVDNTQLILAPVDLRTAAPPPPGPHSPAWLGELYVAIAERMAHFQHPARH